ncbi:MAG: hypothetical protein JW934_08090 [Anaerolineae bacterium]|nr:hypothetical protein [Anaerolineae bacterium]
MLLENGQRLPTVQAAIQIARTLDADAYLFALEALTDKVVALIEKELGGVLDEDQRAKLRAHVDAQFEEMIRSLL